MKITNEIFENLIVKDSLNKLFRNNELPIKLSFNIAKFRSKLIECEKMYVAEKQKLINKWADRDENEKIIEKDNRIFFIKHGQEFAKEFNELIQIELEIIPLSFPLNSLPDNLKSPEIIGNLMQIFDIKGD